METVKVKDIEVKKEALDAAKKYFQTKNDIETIQKMFEWFEYAAEINKTMSEIGGKGTIQKIYE